MKIASILTTIIINHNETEVYTGLECRMSSFISNIY